MGNSFALTSSTMFFFFLIHVMCGSFGRSVCVCGERPVFLLHKMYCVLCVSFCYEHITYIFVLSIGTISDCSTFWNGVPK